MISMRNRPAWYPIRRTGSQILVEEDSRRLALDLTNTVRPALACCRPITHMRQHGRTNLGVIGQDVCFGGSRRRIEHLVEVAELDRSAVDGHYLVLRRPGHKPSIDAAVDAWKCAQTGIRRIL